MNKEVFIDAVKAKKGFHSIIQDELAPDHITGDPIEKRFLYINHLNADGTMGKTFVYYLYDTVKNIASFYNVEPENVDAKEPSIDQKKIDALQAYLKQKYNAYFVGRFDTVNNWAEADVFVLTAGKLVKKSVIVYKQGSSPIADLEVV